MTRPFVVTNEQLRELSGEAMALPRQRKNLNVHPELDDPVQRMFNAMEPDTYVVPHRHARDNGWELMMCLTGAFSILLFDDDGQVTHRYDLDAEGSVRMVEIPAWSWHCLVSHRPGTMMFEVKPGPYSALGDKDFARWAPAEGRADSRRFRDWYATAQPGDKIPLLTS
jgi:cupin fold WbuC family metalloprotein